MNAIRTKAQMYAMLNAGSLGNTVPQFFSVASWEASPDYPAFALWGIRSSIAGADKRCRLNVPTGQVAPLFNEWFPSGGGNISPMIDMYAILRGEVIDTIHAPRPGLNLFYVPPEAPIDQADPWRGSFRNHGKQAAGAAARLVLEQYLWPSDLDDLYALVERYPEHTIEFSACWRKIGVMPNRRMCVWEVRKY